MNSEDYWFAVTGRNPQDALFRFILFYFPTSLHFSLRRDSLTTSDPFPPRPATHRIMI